MAQTGLKRPGCFLLVGESRQQGLDGGGAEIAKRLRGRDTWGKSHRGVSIRGPGVEGQVPRESGMGQADRC